jgi:hypothetical protein
LRNSTRSLSFKAQPVVSLVLSVLLVGCSADRQDRTGSAPRGPGSNADSSSGTVETGPGSDRRNRDTLPAPVARTRRILLDAVRSRDYAALERETGKARDTPFNYSFGDEYPGGAVAFWKNLVQVGHSDPLTVLGQLFEGQPAKRGDLYVWPAWFDEPLIGFSPARRDSMERLMEPGSWKKMQPNGFYIGPRTAIREDGLWVYYVSGD